MGPGPILALTASALGRSLLLASLVGWAALLGSGHWLAVPDYCGVSARHWVERGWQGLESALLFNPPARLIPAWLLMLLAMMPPLLAEPVKHLWDRSLARRRPRAIAMFAASYAAVWMGAGVVLTAAAVALKALVGAVWLAAPALAAAIALLWQVAPAKQICLNRCHRLPRLSAFDWAADRDCLRYGLVAGSWCVGACWALMLVPLVADRAHVAAMAVGALFLLIERQTPARPAKWRLPGRTGAGAHG